MASNPLFAYLENLNVPRNVKADVWDHFHAAQTSADFQQRFSGIDFPRQAKADLWDLKYHDRLPPLPDGKIIEPELQPQKQPRSAAPRQSSPTAVISAYRPTAWDRVKHAIMGEPGEETLPGRLVHGIENMFASKEDRYKRALTQPYNTERYAQGRGMRLLALEQLLPPESSRKNEWGRDTLRFISELTDPRPLDAFENGVGDLSAPESQEKLSAEDQQRMAKMTPGQRSSFIARKRWGKLARAVEEPLLPVNDYWRQQMEKMPQEDRNKWYWRMFSSAGNVATDLIADASSPRSLTLDKGMGALGKTVLSQAPRAVKKLSPKAADLMRKYGPKTVKWLERLPAGQDAYSKMKEAREAWKKGNHVDAGEKGAEALVDVLKEVRKARKSKNGPHGSSNQRTTGERHTGAIPAGGDSNIPVEHNAGAVTRNQPAMVQTQIKVHPVAGQVPQVSDRIKLRDEPKLEGKPNPVDRVQAERVGGKDTRSGRQIVQPSKLPVQNDRLAAQNAPALETRLSAISSAVRGAKFVRLRPQKNLERVQQKVKEGKPAQTISDYLAAQIAADTPEAKDQIIQKLHKEFKVIHVDDKFLKGRPDKGGYPSANVQVKFPNGGTAEVQIVPREAQQITDTTHHLYKEGRNARDAGETTRARQVLDQARKLNQAALKQFQRRNQLSKGQTVTLTSGGQATVQYVSPTMNVVRVRTAEGKTRTVRLNQIQKGAISS